MLKWIFSLCFLFISIHLPANDKVIYGKDDRQDVYAIADNLLAELSKSTLAMISKQKLIKKWFSSDYELKTSPLTSRGICSSERFAHQPSAARCSGFLVSSDLLVTAAHCVDKEKDCKDFYWVFDYKMKSEMQAPTKFKPDQVYTCKKVVALVHNNGTYDDYAVVKLDRAVDKRKALSIRREGDPRIGDPLAVIGHPIGLPTKISDGGAIREMTRSEFFVANLDTYGGNSGSAVINRKSGVVEGLLVRGEIDFIEQDNCKVSKICGDSECRGEDVIYIRRLAHHIPLME